MATIAQNLDRIEKAKNKLVPIINRISVVGDGFSGVSDNDTIDKWVDSLRYAVYPKNNTQINYKLFKYECVIPIIYKGGNLSATFYTSAAYPTIVICTRDGSVIASKCQHYDEGAYSTISIGLLKVEIGNVPTNELVLCFTDCDALTERFYPVSVNGADVEPYCYARGKEDYSNEIVQNLGIPKDNVLFSFNTNG